MTELTPIEKYDQIYIKRDDLYSFAGCYGGKVRTCRTIAEKAKAKGIEGLVTAAARVSPQAKITAAVGKAMGMKVRAFIPYAKNGLDRKMIEAQELGARLEFIKPGYNSVLKARARENAIFTGWAEVPFGMDCREAVVQTAMQVENIPKDVKRIVIPVGSGNSVAGVLVGLLERRMSIPIIGIQVGADPRKLLTRQTRLFAWNRHITLLKAPQDYHEEVEAELFGIKLDEIYEAKCVPFLESGDLFWLVGRR